MLVRSLPAELEWLLAQLFVQATLSDSTPNGVGVTSTIYNFDLDAKQKQRLSLECRLRGIGQNSNMSQCDELTGSPEKSQKESQENQRTLKQLGENPAALLLIPGLPGLPYGYSLGFLVFKRAFKGLHRAFESPLKGP